MGGARAPREGDLRFISTRTHGVLDYVVGALLIVVPYILGFADGTAAQWVPQVLGLVAIGGALMTDYEPPRRSSMAKPRIRDTPAPQPA